MPEVIFQAAPQARDPLPTSAVTNGSATHFKFIASQIPPGELEFKSGEQMLTN